MFKYTERVVPTYYNTTQARPVESDAGLVRELLSALQKQQQQEPQPQPTVDIGIHALMAHAPLLSGRHDLVPFPLSSWGDPALLALREEGRVIGGGGGSGGGGSGGNERFFSEAWAFRTVAGAWL